VIEIEESDGLKNPVGNDFDEGEGYGLEVAAPRVEMSVLDLAVVAEGAGSVTEGGVKVVEPVDVINNFVRAGYFFNLDVNHLVCPPVLSFQKTDDCLCCA
jgi:hypothetical protein